jgi:hypothetical protein
MFSLLLRSQVIDFVLDDIASISQMMKHRFHKTRQERLLHPIPNYLGMTFVSHKEGVAVLEDLWEEIGPSLGTQEEDEVVEGFPL